MYRKKVHLHFVGIGGIGMSGIATILRYQGYTISGCDLDLNQPSIKQLQEIGCTIFPGNNTPECHRTPSDIVVYSSAVKPTNPEILAAQERGIPTIARGVMLAELMRTKYSVAVAGSHGKTTTTSLISHILMEAHYDPTIIIGGHLKSISSNARLGMGDFVVAETDESDRSLLYLQPTLAIVTNIDLEHLETYTDLDDIKNTFKQFFLNIPFYGKAFICIDDHVLRSLLPLSHLKIIKYGIDYPADFQAKNIILNSDHSIFDVWHAASGNTLGTIHLSMPGKHNILNALGALALAYDLGVPFQTIQQALRSFSGIDRRFSYKGTFKGAEIFDDYGHHPQEIYNTLLVANKRKKRKLTVLFQPHRYTRTQKLWDLFIQTFISSAIDHLIITDIYPASEAPIANITSQRLVEEIKNSHFQGTISYVPYESHFSSIKQEISPLLEPDDLLLLLGAGRINRLVENLD